MFVAISASLITYALRPKWRLSYPQLLLKMLCEQLFGSLCAPALFFLGVMEELDQILVLSLLSILYVLIVYLSTLQRMIKDADQIIDYVSCPSVSG